MTIIFSGGETSSGWVEHDERRRYISFLKTTDLRLLDTLYDKNKKLYGFIDRNYEIVYPNPETTLFGPYAGTTSGLNYVVSLFNKFRDFYLNLASETDITVPPQISSLTPSRSYDNLEEKYAIYQIAVATVLLKYIADNSSTALNFEEFCHLVNRGIFSEGMRDYRVTKSGYALSSGATVYNTGLYVDMGRNYQPHLDALKGQMIQDPGFKCYVEIANEYGFYVDINAPWRIALNLNSSVAQRDILNGRDPHKFYDFLSDHYMIKTSYDDYDALKTFYEALYIQYKTQILSGEPPQERDREGALIVAFGGSTHQTEFWLETLLLNRFRELGLVPSVFPRVLSETLDRYRHQGLMSPSFSFGAGMPTVGALGFISQFCAQELKRIILEEP